MKRLLFLVLVLAWLPASAQLKLGSSTGDLLEPEKAFRFSARSVDASLVEVRFAIAEGYYMYRDRMRFEAQGARLGKPEFPPGIAHKDDFFGEQQIYRKDVRIRIPVQGAGAFDLKVTSQGCADIGVCYVPMESTAALRVAAGGAAAAPSPLLRQAIWRSRGCSRTACRWCWPDSWCSACCSRSRPACCR